MYINPHTAYRQTYIHLHIVEEKGVSVHKCEMITAGI